MTNLTVMFNHNRPFPVNITRVEVQVVVKGKVQSDATAKGEIESTSFRTQDKISLRCGGKAYIEMDWDYENASRIDMVIEMNIVRLIGDNDRNIAKKDWERKGVI